MYSPSLIENFLKALPEIESFLERVTSELFVVQYIYDDERGYFSQEGNTLQDRGPHNTRIPKRDSLRENLLIMKADIESALSKLDPPDQLSILMYYVLGPASNKEILKHPNIAHCLEQMANYLNYGSSTNDQFVVN